jgi:hypothetical protein
MALFDNMNPALAQNGQSPPNPQQTSGAPDYPTGAWGNQAPNLAGGLQQFVQGQGAGNPFMARLQAAMQQNPQLAQLFGGSGGQMPLGGPQTPASAGSANAMQPPIPQAGQIATPGAGGTGGPPQGNPMGMQPGMLAAGMQRYLGR